MDFEKLIYFLNDFFISRVLKYVFILKYLEIKYLKEFSLKAIIYQI